MTHARTPIREFQVGETNQTHGLSPAFHCYSAGAFADGVAFEAGVAVGLAAG